mmetsp:Transcript_82942/g.173663  ORF Transcript_82942/g.173663 Transcript_82942/m.173663 type:complete len:222 (+) Transcript_82942:52-717(+)
MSTKEQNKLIVVLARKGRLDGDQGLRTVVAEAVKMQLDLNFCEKPFYRAALWEATWKNHEGCVKLLVEKGAQVDFADYQKRTPLHEAAYYGHINLVEYFLDKGHPIDPLDKFNQTPLFRAVEGCRQDVVELLMKRKAAVNLLDGDNVTVQHIAAFNGMPALSEWLVTQGSTKNRFAIEETYTGERVPKPTAALAFARVPEEAEPEVPADGEQPAEEGEKAG